MKIMVCGHATHGKDTASGIICAAFKMTFESSSYFVAEKAVRPYLVARGLVYATLEECYADRVNHRKMWHDAIREYNTPDRARMARELYAKHDIYCGLRNREEFLVIREQKLFDVSVWIEDQRKPRESIESMQIRREDCDLIIDNSTTLLGLRIRTIGVIRDAMMLW